VKHLGRRLAAPIILALAIGVLLVACSRGDGATPATVATPGDGSQQVDGGTGHGHIPLLAPGGPQQASCDLIEASEISAVAGEPLANPTPLALGPPLGQEVCTFGSADRGTYAVAQVSVVREEGFEPALSESGFTVTKLFDQTLLLYPNAVLVPGIGDAAFRHDDTLEVLVGDVMFSVSLSVSDGIGRSSPSLETLVAIAELVLPRLDLAR
jgi:hypothetical protein